MLCCACGGAAGMPEPRAAEPAPDPIAGCWRDGADGVVLCLEERGYVLFLPDGKWDRVIVDWAEKTTRERSGRTRTPRPLWLSVRLTDNQLVMDDGASETRLERPPPQEQSRLDARIARLPQLEQMCERARACRELAQATLGVEVGAEAELSSGRACLAYLNALGELLRRSERPVPAECGG
jgi:hypothetical protein